MMCSWHQMYVLVSSLSLIHLRINLARVVDCNEGNVINWIVN
jgi:hypothetical protein